MNHSEPDQDNSTHNHQQNKNKHTTAPPQNKNNNNNNNNDASRSANKKKNTKKTLVHQRFELLCDCPFQGSSRGRSVELYSPMLYKGGREILENHLHNMQRSQR
ncbi:unnamed protein product [Polarella glacialis]|uniref:Uncharacterized protein n=1 Tax=Polarella glacialis TaxID=89957 RepID=A0A813IS79_POLGL|nr:unnamed protein product [Polarella glacialis]